MEKYSLKKELQHSRKGNNLIALITTFLLQNWIDFWNPAMTKSELRLWARAAEALFFWSPFNSVGFHSARLAQNHWLRLHLLHAAHLCVMDSLKLPQRDLSSSRPEHILGYDFTRPLHTEARMQDNEFLPRPSEMYPSAVWIVVHSVHADLIAILRTSILGWLSQVSDYILL